MAPKVVAIGGFSSNAGKTSLVCRLLGVLRGWEAVKVTKGHYRSCGKDPHACCVSHLLADEPLVLSGRTQTYAAGKDTGRYWEAGASNVHWVVATKPEVAGGLRRALDRVAPDAPGVLVEGTGFVRDVPVDYTVLVAAVDGREMKASAAAVFPLADALYVFGGDGTELAGVRALLAGRRIEAPLPRVFADDDVAALAKEIVLARRA
jgi:molybdopterin-guanine dinucleotide biosynthesis protein